MSDLTLYHAAPSRSSIVLWMLEEIGLPYTIEPIRLSAGDNLKPNYLAINPMGKVPALRHGNTFITEVAAICAYLADEFPDRKLNVPVGTPRRGVYLKWLFFGPGVFEPAMADRAFPRQQPPRPSSIGWRGFDQVLDIVAEAIGPGPWLMGEQFTTADVVIGADIRWGMMFKMLPDRPEFATYAARLAARPAAQRAAAKDKELAAA